MDPTEKDRRKLEARIKKFKGSKRDDTGISAWEGFSLLGSLGLVVAASIIIGLGAGVYLDRKLHTEPWLTLAGLFLGLVAAGFGSYELIRSILRGKL